MSMDGGAPRMALDSGQSPRHGAEAPIRQGAADRLTIEVGAGELVDKITILRLKAERIGGRAARANVLHELAALETAAAAHLRPSRELDALWADLAAVNARLWTIEDEIRLCEGARDFGPAFVALARAVYQTNDRRAALKKRINRLLGASIVEEKSYAGSGLTDDVEAGPVKA